MSRTHPRRACLAGLVLGLLAGAVGVRAGDAQKDQQKLQGNWQMTAFIVDGKDEPKYAQGKSLVVQGDQMTTVAKVGDKETREKGRFKLDPSKNPKEIDVTGEEGKDKGKVTQGIYALEGDTLKIAVALSKRPSDFTPKKGSQVLVLTFRRAKK